MERGGGGEREVYGVLQEGKEEVGDGGSTEGGAGPQWRPETGTCPSIVSFILVLSLQVRYVKGGSKYYRKSRPQGGI